MLGEYIGNPTNTKGLYHLNGNANDSSGNGNNGTPTNVTWVGGIVGSGSASFNGSSSQILIPHNTSLNISSITISGWFYTSNTGNPHRLVSKTSTGTSWDLGLGGTNGTNKRFYWLTKGTSNFDAVQNNTDLPINTWINFVVTYDQTNINIFVNGKNDYSALATYGGPLGTDTNPIYIGRRADGLYFNGLIDEIIIENRAWTATEIQKYYTSAKGRFIN